MRHSLLISSLLTASALALVSDGSAFAQQSSRAEMLTNPVQGGGAFLQPEKEVLPKTLFKGCEDDSLPPTLSNGQSSNPRDQIERARDQSPGQSGRVFAPVEGSASPDEPQADPGDHCWFRLDGLWVERRATPVFDTNFDADGWGDGADTPELRALTHSVYNRSRFLIVRKTGRENEELIVERPLLGSSASVFSAQDTLDLQQTLAPGGPAKRYRAAQTRGGAGQNLTVRVIGGSVVMLEMDGQQFVRPKPELSARERAERLPTDDAFNRDSTIQFLDVVAKGFDVTKQNPNRLAENDKDFVFAQPGPRDYYTKDRKIVPIDMALDLRSDQGAVYFSSLMSSATEIQKAYASNFGISTKVGVSGSKSGSNRSQTRSSSVNLEASIGFGASFSNSQFSQMRRSNSVSQAIGFSRQKQFALVRDYAQTELNPFFRDAIASAVERGNFGQVIATYGTHYPHATTYGASGQVRHTTTRTGFQELVSNSSSQSYEGGGKFLIAEVNASGGSSRQNTSSFESSTEYGRAYFDAVGGNGSWNEGGFSAGQTAYPILMDMRPLDEMLNPINFPGEPDIYERGRREFARAIDNYLVRAGRQLDRTSLRPRIVPKQRWTIRALSLNCMRSGSLEGNKDRIQLKGQMRLNVNYPTEGSRIVFDVTNKAGYRGLFCDGRNYTASDATRYVLEGTAEELASARYAIATNFDEVDFGSPIRALRVHQQGGLAQALRPDKIFQGTSRWFSLPRSSELNSSGKLVRQYGVPGGSAGKQPDLRLRIEFERIE